MRIFYFFLFTSICFCGCNKTEKEFTANVTLYPNPFETYISLELELQQTSEVEIYVYSPYLKAQMPGSLTPKEDEDGPVLAADLASGTHNYSFDFTSFENGVYILDVIVNGVSKRSRIIKQ